MEKTQHKQSKKGKNKEKKKSQQIQEVTFTSGSWNERISVLRKKNETAVSQVGSPKNVKYQQFVKSTTVREQSGDITPLNKKGQVKKEVLNVKQSDPVPKYRILRRQPEDVPEKGAAMKDTPEKGATPSSARQQGATPDGVPGQAGTSSGAAQGTRETTKLNRGPVQTKQLWIAPPPYRTPLKDSGEVKHRQSANATTVREQSGDITRLNKKGQVKKEVLNVKQSDPVPKYRILRRQPEDVPEKGAAMKDAPEKGATPSSARQQGATPDGVPGQAGTSSGAAQGTRETTKLNRGPVQTKQLWIAPPPYRTPLKDSGEVKHRQSANAITGREQSGDITRLNKKGQVKKEVLNIKQSDPVPKYRILRRQPEDVPEKGAAVKDAPEKGATPSNARQQAATPDGVPEQAGTSSGAAQGTWEATELPRGLVRRKQLWIAPPPYCTPLNKHSGELKVTDFRRSPVQHKKLWTEPHHHNSQHAKPKHADSVKTCEVVEATPQQATIHVPESQIAQLETRETESTNSPKMENDASAGLLEQLHQSQEETCDVTEAVSQQATNHVPEPQIAQFETRETESTNSLKVKSDASAGLLEQLKETEDKACEVVEATPQQATIHVPEPQIEQFETRETESTNSLKMESDASAGLLEQLKETEDKACEVVEATPQQATIHVPEPQIEQFETRETESTNSLKMESDASAGLLEQLKETEDKACEVVEATPQQATIHVPEPQIEQLEIRETECTNSLETENDVSTAPIECQQVRKALQNQEESQKEQDMHLTKVTEENNRQIATRKKRQSELESQQLQGQEENSHLQGLSDSQHTLEVDKSQQTRWDSMTETIAKLEEQVKKMKKPKKPSLWKRFIRLFK
uniref:uncharacterized protein LOC124051270 n=1 Tax=Scatophagus argus TaxID=75038 RepID=UPI001ED7D270|nr:uncharacterized protein LOC124051270 [Scatophagus argus]